MSQPSLPNPDSIALRNRWVAELSEISHRQLQLQGQRDPAHASAAAKIDRELEQLQERQDELSRLYKAWLPVVPLSRCPFCNAVVQRSIDTVDISGPWWDYYSPIRKEVGYDDPHAMCFNGAVELLGPVAQYAELVTPGPQSPFVVPRVLEVDGVRAVLYQLPIGPHRGFTMWYFAEKTPADVDLVNDWATQAYSVRQGKVDGLGKPTFGWNESFDLIDDYDFDLKPWIASGKLLWIQPGDVEMELHSELVNCPYLNSPGLRQIMYLRDGHVWTGEDDDDDPSEFDDSPIEGDDGIYGDLENDRWDSDR